MDSFLSGWIFKFSSQTYASSNDLQLTTSHSQKKEIKNLKRFSSNMTAESALSPLLQLVTIQSVVSVKSKFWFVNSKQDLRVNTSHKVYFSNLCLTYYVKQSYSFSLCCIYLSLYIYYFHSCSCTFFVFWWWFSWDLLSILS